MHPRGQGGPHLPPAWPAPGSALPIYLACPASSSQEQEPESIKLDDLLEKEARQSRFRSGIRLGGRGAWSCCGRQSVPRAEPGLRGPALSPLTTGLCAPPWGTLIPACKAAPHSGGAKSPDRDTLSSALWGDPAQPAAWGTALPGCRPPPGSWGWRGAGLSCQGLHRWPWARVRGYWGSLHSQKHFSRCRPMCYHRGTFGAEPRSLRGRDVGQPPHRPQALRPCVRLHQAEGRLQTEPRRASGHAASTQLSACLLTQALVLSR